MPAIVDFWLPALELRSYVSGYHRYELTREPDQERFSDVFFPAWSNIRFTIDAEPWSVQLGRRSFDPIPDCASGHRAMAKS